MPVRFDYELIEQAVTDKPLNDTKDFYVVQDKDRQPIVFSIGTDGKLYAIQRDSLGRNEVINLSSSCSVPSDQNVEAVAVLQSKDSTILLAFAYGKPGTASTVKIFKPFKPGTMDLKTSDLTQYFMTGGSFNDSVYGLILGEGFNEISGPLVVAKTRSLNGSQDDIARINVTSNNSWSIEADLEMPCNPRDIISLCAGSLPAGFGVFVLYKINDNTRIVFAGLKGKSGYYTPLYYSIPVPPGASYLSTAMNTVDCTDLLIAASDGIYWLTARQCSSSPSKLPDGSKIATGDGLSNLKQIHSAQSGSILSIWSRSGSDDILYNQFEVTMDEKRQGVLSPLSGTTPVVTGSLRFAALIDQSTRSQSLFLLGNESNASMRTLFQDSTTKLWTLTDFAVPAILETRQVMTYTTHIKIENEPGNRNAVVQELSLSASRQCNATVNGRYLQLSRDPIKIRPDLQSSITIIQEVDDLNAVSLCLDGVPGISKQYLDPSAKVVKFFANLQSANDLKQARLPNGEKLLEGTPNEKQLRDAATALSSLNRRYKEMGPESQFSDNAMANKTVEDLELALTSDASSKSWASFDWFTSAVETIGSLVVDGWNLVVRIGDSLIKFIIETAEHVMKAIKKVFEWIGAKLQKLWDGLKWLFEWQDILATHNIYRNYVNDFMDIAVAGVHFMGSSIDGWLGEMEKTAREKYDPDIQPPGADKEVGEGRQEAKTLEEEKMEQALSSPGANYANYHSQHTPETRRAIASAGGDLSRQDPLVVIWTAIQTLLREFWEGGKDIGSSFVEILQPGRKTTVGEIVSKLGGKLLVKLISAVRTLIKAVFDVGTSVISSIKTFLNDEIKIPIISWLWSKISDHPLSILDAVCLTLAIPATVAFKAVFGKAPTEHPDHGKIESSRTELRKAIEELKNSSAPPAESFGFVPSEASAPLPIGPDEDEVEEADELRAERKANADIEEKDEQVRHRPKTADEAGEEVAWDNIFDRIIDSNPIQRMLEWIEAHGGWIGIGYSVYNTYKLIREYWEWKPEVELETYPPDQNGERALNPNFQLDPDQGRFPTGFRWKKWDVASFVGAWALAFPRNIDVPSWGLRFVSWILSSLAVFKHAVNQRLRGILSVFQSLVQAAVFTVCWIWDLGSEAAESLPVILNAYLARAHDILSGVAMTQGGANIYVNVACTGCGAASTVIGSILLTLDVETDIDHFIIRA